MSTLLTFINRGTLHASNNEPYVSSENDEFGYEDYPVLLSFINRGTLKASNNEPYVSSENEEFGYQEYPALLNYTDPGTFVTIGGRVYRTVVIENQEWLAENLDYKFSGLIVGENGTSETEPKANYYNNNEATYGVNGNKYGLLYNWPAAKYLNQNKAILLPEGWHVPTTTEWNTLATAVGGASTAGTKLKSTTGWSSGAGTDDFGLTVYPAGYYGGSFYDLGSSTGFWTITENGSIFAYRSYIGQGENINTFSGGKFYQYSLRLVKNL